MTGKRPGSASAIAAEAFAQSFAEIMPDSYAHLLTIKTFSRHAACSIIERCASVSIAAFPLAKISLPWSARSLYWLASMRQPIYRCAVHEEAYVQTETLVALVEKLYCQLRMLCPTLKLRCFLSVCAARPIRNDVLTRDLARISAHPQMIYVAGLVLNHDFMSITRFHIAAFIVCLARIVSIRACQLEDTAC